MRLSFSLMLLSAALIGCQPSANVPADATQQVFTCPMHPEIRESKEGKCAICQMELVAIDPNNSESNEANATSAKAVNKHCPIMGGDVADDGGTAMWENQLIGFCCPGCEEKWEKLSDEEKAKKLAAADATDGNDAKQKEHDHS